MASCERCGKTLGIFERSNGQCESCWRTTLAERREQQDHYDPQIAVDDDADALAKIAAETITLSTEAAFALPDGERLGIVTGTCIFGSHLGKDIMAAWRDIAGGRVASAEKMFREARTAALEDLRLDAARLGADTVIAVRIEHQELGGGGKSMVMVTATGTAIKHVE